MAKHKNDKKFFTVQCSPKNCDMQVWANGRDEIQFVIKSKSENALRKDFKDGKILCDENDNPVHTCHYNIIEII